MILSGSSHGKAGAREAEEYCQQNRDKHRHDKGGYEGLLKKDGLVERQWKRDLVRLGRGKGRRKIGARLNTKREID